MYHPDRDCFQPLGIKGYTFGGKGNALRNFDSEDARAYFESSVFFNLAALVARHSQWLLVLVVAVPLIAWFSRGQNDRAA